MDISHLGLTILGPFEKDFIVGHTCFTSRFAPLSKLESIDLQLGSAFVSENDHVECLQSLKKQLIKSYRVSQKGQPKMKRAATYDILQSKEGKKPAKVAKKVSYPKLPSTTLQYSSF